MSSWKDDGEYWTRKGTIHHKGGGKWSESVRKDMNFVIYLSQDTMLKQTTQGVRKC